MVRAASHVHSTWSYDGTWPLEDLAAAFTRRNYRVVMMTEHDRGFTEARRLEHREACARASSDELLLLPGIEYSDAENTVHVLVWGNVPFVGEGAPTAALLSAVRAGNGLAVLAHPARRKAWKVFDSAWAGYLAGIEVWNTKTDGWRPSRAALQILKHSELRCFAGMDFHDRRQFFPLTMLLDVPGRVSEGSVLESLRSGRFHARAFGVRLDRHSLGTAVVALAFPEWVRRLTAAGWKRLTRPNRRPHRRFPLEQYASEGMQEPPK
jgi:hypothetical protein